mgnify:FL=1
MRVMWRAVPSVITGFSAACVATVIASCTSGQSIYRLDQDLIAVVITSGLLASVLAYGDAPLTGALGGLLLAAFSCFILTIEHQPANPVAYLIGVLVGCLISRYPIRIGVLSAVCLFALGVVYGKFALFAFLASTVVGVALKFGSERLTFYLRLPLQRKRIATADVASLIAFVGVYIVIICLFALLYTAANNSAPDLAFRSQMLSKSDFNLPFFLYYSAVTITTVGAAEVTPVTRESRALVALEPVTGLLWFGIYFALLMRGFRKD